jgi:YbbR domain-containing protein
MAIVKLSKNERRRLSGFVTCLVLAIVAWLLTNLSKPNPYTVKMVIEFTNAPLRRSFRPLQSDTVDVKLQGTGWNLLFTSMHIENHSISVDLKNLDSHNFIVLASQLKAINDKRPADRQIITIAPDTLYFDFSSRAVKRVPVQLQYRIGFRQQFGIADHITLRPDYVTVSGPAAVLDKITSWKTDSLILQDIENPITQNVRLKGVGESNMAIYPRQVQARVPVDEFTEKTVEVPIKLVNNKNYYNVKIVPQKVKVTFMVALSKYALINNTDFAAVVDLDQWDEQHNTELTAKVSRYPDFCRIVSIQPQKIDFIVKK